MRWDGLLLCTRPRSLLWALSHMPAKSSDIRIQLNKGFAHLHYSEKKYNNGGFNLYTPSENINID